jgi:hypothetical protein
VWGVPLIKGVGGWYLRSRTKMHDAGTVLLGAAAAEVTVLLVGWATGLLAGPAQPAAGDESAAWMRMQGNFPRPQLTHPYSNKGTLDYAAASRRVTDPVPASGYGNMATAI